MARAISRPRGTPAQSRAKEDYFIDGGSRMQS